MSTCEPSCRDSSKGLKSYFDVMELCPGHEAAAKSLLGRLEQEIGRQAFAGAVVQSAPRVGDRHGAEPGMILRRYIRVVEHHACWHTEASAPPAAWKREMHVSWQGV
jgi:hypothetical protein